MANDNKMKTKFTIKIKKNSSLSHLNLAKVKLMDFAKKRKKTGRKFTPILILIIVIFLIFIIDNKNQQIQANFADNILRPIVGEKITLSLESFYFGINDKIKTLQYSIVKPNNNELNISFKKNFKLIKQDNDFNLSPINFKNHFYPLKNEGVWNILPNYLFSNNAVLAETFLRPDKERSYALVSLVKINMQKLSIGLQAGTYYPGGPFKAYGKGYVPKKIQNSNSLLAVFNGGFQAKDGNYGLILGGKTFIPLIKNMPTIAIYNNGSTKIIDYTGQKIAKNIIALRQNGPYLIKNSQITQFVENDLDTWGRTTTNSIYTWRSGLGITKNGNVIYAVGPSLIPKTLALALKEAGAVNAIQLDINPFWVRFILYQSLGSGKYTHSSLLKNMQDGGYQYLHGYNKDFFYIYKK